MSISTELIRMAQNVGALNADTNAIFEALRAKGVDVPANAQLSDVADMIESIVPPHQNEVEIGGRWYPYVQIGNQLWMTENLDWKFSGCIIGASGTSSSESRANYYNNDESIYGVNGNKYGLLYNHIATEYLETNKSTLFPSGWRIPTLSDCNTLISNSGGVSSAGRGLKSTHDWGSYSGDNSYGFTAIPSGYYGGTFSSVGSFASFWNMEEYYAGHFGRMEFGIGDAVGLYASSSNYQYSLRLVKDAPGYVTIGGRQYKTVTIGNQEWLAENLDYSDSNITIGGGASTSPAANYYNNDEVTYGWDGYKCGLLYNWYAVNYLETNKSTLFPSGWHVPSANDFQTVKDTVNDPSNDGYKLSKGDLNWAPNWTGNNEIGFNLIPSGQVSLDNYNNFNFCYLGEQGVFRCTTPNKTIDRYINVRNNLTINTISSLNEYKAGCPLRLVKDIT